MLIQDRRELHKIPEVGLDLPLTQIYLEERLLGMGLSPRRIGSGLVVDLGEEGPMVAWRADMDALPIQEETELPFSSCHAGVMHACGHDAHMAIALGVAEHFSKSISLQGFRLRVIFQPGEEGHGGADKMIEGGALEGVDAIFGLHVRSSNPEIPIGGFGTRKGSFMAAAHKFTFIFEGIEAHGATPHMGADALTTACQFVVSLSGLKSRLNALRPIVISVGEIHGGTACNVIPGEVTVKGTFRTFEDGAEEVATWIEQIAEGVTSIYQTGYDMRIEAITGEVSNTEELVDLLKESIEEVGEVYTPLTEVYMGSEDFASYQTERPGVFFYFNAGFEDEEQIFRQHHPKFNIDDSLLPKALTGVIGLITKWGTR